ncbi:MAG TPA: hypothetical protein VGD27_16155 [Longimicrobiales bacterium]
MQNPFTHCSEQHRVDAVAELRAELADFNHDGLIQLIEDLKHGAVTRGTWTGCVISYKRGSAGSARRDRLGRARNPFTILWDNGWITDEEVVALACAEIAARHQAALQKYATKLRYENALQNCARRRARAVSASL